MEEDVLLYDSTVCRLCAEGNENGILLYSVDESEPDLSTTVNRYLPLQVRNDGKYPRTICPGCNIQLDSLVQFINLIICGQEKLRELWRSQVENARRREKELIDQNLFIEQSFNLSIPSIDSTEDNELLLQFLPNGSIYTPDHAMTLKAEGLEKPRRKRGRPPKPPPGTEKLDEIVENPSPELKEDSEEDVDGRKRRRRKAPSRYKEAIKGKELERIFREEGVIDEEDVSDVDDDVNMRNPAIVTNADEVIGHLENKDGQDLGELIVVNKGKQRVKGKNRRRKNFTCDICGRCFIHYGRYVIHKSFHKNVRYECNACGDLFLSKNDLLEHQTLFGHIGEGIIEGLENEVLQPCDGKKLDIVKEEETFPDHKFPCDQCDKSFMSKQSYEVHVKAIHQGQKPFQCEKCNKTFAYQASLKGHMSSHEQKSDKGSYPCDICNKIFNHPSSVIYHKEAEHNNGRRFVCNKCGKSFKHKQLLQRHQLVHTDDRPFICKSCGASFKTRANLLNHQPTHTGIKKYFCQQCGQLFAHKTSLTLHYRWHTGQKPYECSVCKKTFSQKGNLEEHKRIHTGEKPFSCSFCGRKFTTSSQYKLHVKRHTGERPWSCEYCSKTFLHKDTWKCHMRRHRNERPFRCNSCSRDFTEQWALKKHLRLHTGEKPYSCDVCNKAFADCSNLTKHKRAHHRNNKTVPEPITAVQPPATNEDVNQIIYVTYQEPSDTEDIPALVHILDENATDAITDSTTTTSSVLVQADEPIDNALINPNENAELELENFDTLNTTQLQVTDEEGNPLYFTTQNGEQFRVTTFDGENLQACLDDGTVIPVELTVQNNKATIVEAVQTQEQFKDKDFKIDDQIMLPDLSDSKLPIDDSTLLERPVQLLTEEGENVCFVTAYNIESENLNSAYLSMA